MALQCIGVTQACCSCDSQRRLNSPNPRTYIGSGKVAEIKSAIHALGVETVIFDDELSAG